MWRVALAGKDDGLNDANESSDDDDGGFFLLAFLMSTRFTLYLYQGLRHKTLLISPLE